MSWLKKAVHKVHHSIKKDWRKIGHSLKRASQGRFHVGHQIRSSLPKSLQKSFNKLRWSKLVKNRLLGNNSAATISISGGAPANGYVYSGRRISEMM